MRKLLFVILILALPASAQNLIQPAQISVPNGDLIIGNSSGKGSVVAGGTAATANTGTSGHTVPYLDGANTWSAAQTFGSTFTIGANANQNVAGNPTSTTAAMYETEYLFGQSSSTNAAWHYFGTSDQANSASANNQADDWFFGLSYGGANSFGNRNATHARCALSAPLNGAPNGAVTSDSCVGSLMDAYATTGTYGTGQGGLNSPGAYSSGLFGGNTITRAVSAKQIRGMWGLELDLLADSASTGLAVKVGYQMTQLPGSAVQGAYVDQATAIVNQDNTTVKWLCGFCLGSATASWPIDVSNGTAIGFVPRIYSGTETQGALYGMDMRALTVASGGQAIAAPNFGLDGSGNINAASLNTVGTIAAQAATLTGVTMLPDGDGITGGLYTAAPTITVAAPPAGGSTATVTAATYGLGKIVGFGSTGSAYTANDALTSVGGVGTQPVFKAATVNGAGAVTSCTVTSGGTMSTYPTGQIVYPTGGTGTGAALFVTWSNKAAIACAPAATGKNYIAGDTVGAAGTGTPGVLTIDTVDAFGGILTAHQTTVGSITAFPASPVAVTGGSGTGATPIIGYSILTMSYGAGSGYACTPPQITSSQSLYRTARFNAVMTCASAPLTLTGTTVSAPSISLSASEFLTSPSAAFLKLGQADAASPVAQTLGVQGVVAGTSNTAGQNLTIQGGNSTGNASGGSILFQVAGSGSSGTAQNAYTTILQVNPSSVQTNRAIQYLGGAAILLSAGNVLVSNTAPTVASGFGTSPSIPNNNGTAAFTVNVGTGGTANSGVLTLPAAAHSWGCHAEDSTTPATNVTVAFGTSTTSVTVNNYSRTTGLAAAWTASDVLQVECLGY